MFDKTITLESLVETCGLSKAAILAALYNAASKTGHGKKDGCPKTITEAEAAELLKACGDKYQYFDYLNGKRLKIDLTDSEKDGIVAGQYDYGQGRGTAKVAIDILKATGDPCHPDITALRMRSVKAARIASMPLQDSGTTTEGNLAEALELSEPPSDDELKELHQKFGYHSPQCSEAQSRRFNFETHRGTPCTTINL